MGFPSSSWAPNGHENFYQLPGDPLPMQFHSHQGSNGSQFSTHSGGNHQSQMPTYTQPGYPSYGSSINNYGSAGLNNTGSYGEGEVQGFAGTNVSNNMSSMMSPTSSFNGPSSSFTSSGGVTDNNHESNQRTSVLNSQTTNKPVLGGVQDRSEQFSSRTHLPQNNLNKQNNYSKNQKKTNVKMQPHPHQNRGAQYAKRDDGNAINQQGSRLQYGSSNLAIAPATNAGSAQSFQGNQRPDMRSMNPLNTAQRSIAGIEQGYRSGSAATSQSTPTPATRFSEMQAASEPRPPTVSSNAVGTPVLRHRRGSLMTSSGNPATDPSRRETVTNWLEGNPTNFDDTSRSAPRNLGTPPRMLGLLAAGGVDPRTLTAINESDPFTSPPPGALVLQTPSRPMATNPFAPLTALSVPFNSALLGPQPGEMSYHLRMLTKNGTSLPSIDEVLDSKNMPFAETCRLAKNTDNFGVIRIKNVSILPTEMELEEY